MSPVAVQSFLHAFGFGTLDLYWQLWKLPYFPPNEKHLLWRINRKITLLLNTGIRKLFNSGASLSLGGALIRQKNDINKIALVASFICLLRFQFLSRVSRKSKLSRAVLLTLDKPHNSSDIAAGWLSYVRILKTYYPNNAQYIIYRYN